MSDIEVERRGRVAVLTLNRPDALNAFTPPMLEAFDAALRSSASDRSCRAVVIGGAGRAFCAGVDVKSVGASDAGGKGDLVADSFENLHYTLSGVVRTIHALPIPVIGAVHGHAIGGGFAFAAACDLRVAGESAKFADGFVKRGISGCEMGLSYFLPKIVGSARAFEWMMTGRRVEAPEALSAGLVSSVVADDELVERAVALGAAIADNAPMAVSMTKEVMWANLHAASLDHALALESRSQVMTRNTLDAVEARMAFLEKRKPVFVERAGERLIPGGAIGR